MKAKILFLAVGLAGLMAAPSAAVYPFCPDCAIYQMGPNSPCTCPGTGPHWRFSTCKNYPAGCEDAAHSDLDKFLGALADSPTVTASASEER